MTPILFILCVFGSFAFIGFMVTIWENKYQNKVNKQKELETEFDFDQFNQDNFGI